MKRINLILCLLLTVFFTLPGFARDFGQEKNNFTGVQYFEGGVVFGTETDSLDTLTHVSNDTTMADADNKALVTEYAAKTYIDNTKGYKEWIGLITQSGDSVPVITEIVDDIGITTSTTRLAAGYYGVGMSALSEIPIADCGICLSNNLILLDTYPTFVWNTVGAFWNNTALINLWTADTSGTFSDDILTETASVYLKVVVKTQ